MICISGRGNLLVSVVSNSIDEKGMEYIVDVLHLLLPPPLSFIDLGYSRYAMIRVMDEGTSGKWLRSRPRLPRRLSAVQTAPETAFTLLYSRKHSAIGRRTSTSWPR